MEEDTRRLELIKRKVERGEKLSEEEEIFSEQMIKKGHSMIASSILAAAITFFLFATGMCSR